MAVSLSSENNYSIMSSESDVDMNFRYVSGNKIIKLATFICIYFRYTLDCIINIVGKVDGSVLL